MGREMCVAPMLRRAQVFDALIRQPVSFFDTEEVGALTSRLGSDCQAVVRALATNFNVAVRNSMQCVGDASANLCLSRVCPWGRLF